jgi:hypothetical protein
MLLAEEAQLEFLQQSRHFKWTVAGLQFSLLTDNIDTFMFLQEQLKGIIIFITLDRVHDELQRRL